MLLTPLQLFNFMRVFGVIFFRCLFGWGVFWVFFPVCLVGVVFVIFFLCLFGWGGFCVRACEGFFLVCFSTLCFELSRDARPRGPRAGAGAERLCWGCRRVARPTAGIYFPTFPLSPHEIFVSRRDTPLNG